MLHLTSHRHRTCHMTPQAARLRLFYKTGPPTFLRIVGGSVVGGATPVRAESRHCPERDSTPNVPSDPLEKVDGSVRWHFSSLSPRSGLTHRSHLQLKQTPDLYNNDSTISVHCGGRTCQLASTLAHTQRSGHKHICDGGGSSTTTHLYQSDGSRCRTKDRDGLTWYMHTAYRSSDANGNLPDIHAGSSLANRKEFPAEQQKLQSASLRTSRRHVLSCLAEECCWRFRRGPLRTSFLRT